MLGPIRLCFAACRAHSDVHRFEKVSNIIKQFKLSCSKAQAQFATMQVAPPRTTPNMRHPSFDANGPDVQMLALTAACECARALQHNHRVFLHLCEGVTGGVAISQVRNARYSAFIEGFTSTTYVMVIVSDRTIYPATTLINIEASRSHFESLINSLSTVWEKQHASTPSRKWSPPCVIGADDPPWRPCQRHRYLCICSPARSGCVGAQCRLHEIHGPCDVAQVSPMSSTSGTPAELKEAQPIN